MLGEEYYVKNFGVPGASLLKKSEKPYWDQIAYRRALKFSAEIVVIKLGTNDSKAENWQFAEKFVENYCELIETFKNLASQPKIFICLPTPVFGPTYGVNPEVLASEIIPKIKEIAVQNCCEIIDLNTPLQSFEGLFYDKLHPNREGAKIIAETVFQNLSLTVDLQ